MSAKQSECAALVSVACRMVQTDLECVTQLDEYFLEKIRDGAKAIVSDAEAMLKVCPTRQSRFLARALADPCSPPRIVA